MAINDDNSKKVEVDKEMEVGLLMNEMVIFGGPKIGFITNPETEKVPCFIEVGGQKIVCLAQGGECRYNHNYYSPGLQDRKSWTTPIIDESCPGECGYKVLVCDDHDEKCEGSITYYPHYNKFNGQFKRYCRNFDKYIDEKEKEKDIGKIKRQKKDKEPKVRMTTHIGEDGKEVVISDVYYGYYRYKDKK